MILAAQEQCSLAELIRRMLKDWAERADLWPPPETPAERAALIDRLAARQSMGVVKNGGEK